MSDELKNPALKKQPITIMKYIPYRYLLSILSIFIIGSSSAIYAQESAPSFVVVGKNYSTFIGMIELTFTVEKIEGQWIKVKVITDNPEKKTAEEATGDVWLNLRNLSVLNVSVDQMPLNGAKKPKRSKKEVEK